MEDRGNCNFKWMGLARICLCSIRSEKKRLLLFYNEEIKKETFFVLDARVHNGISDRLSRNFANLDLFFS